MWSAFMPLLWVPGPEPNTLPITTAFGPQDKSTIPCCYPHVPTEDSGVLPAQICLQNPHWICLSTWESQTLLDHCGHLPDHPTTRAASAFTFIHSVWRNLLSHSFIHSLGMRAQPPEAGGLYAPSVQEVSVSHPRAAPPLSLAPVLTYHIATQTSSWCAQAVVLRKFIFILAFYQVVVLASK